MRWEELDHPLVSMRVERQGGAATVGSPQSTGGYGEMWSPETGPTVGAPARFRKLRKLATSGKGGGDTGDRRKTGEHWTLPCHGPSPRCSEREDSCYSGGINNPIYYFLLRTGSHTLYDTKSPFSPQEATTIK